MNVESLRELANALPHIEEDIKWQKDLCFCIGGKMFCVAGLEQPEFGASFKAEPEDFGILIEKDGIIPAPYLARYKWVYVSDANVLSAQEWRHYIKRSYELVKGSLSKKKQQELK